MIDAQKNEWIKLYFCYDYIWISVFRWISV